MAQAEWLTVVRTAAAVNASTNARTATVQQRLHLRTECVTGADKPRRGRTAKDVSALRARGASERS